VKNARPDQTRKTLAVFEGGSATATVGAAPAWAGVDDPPDIAICGEALPALFVNEVVEQEMVVHDNADANRMAKAVFFNIRYPWFRRLVHQGIRVFH